MQVVDDNTKGGITTFSFLDGSTISAIQNHSAPGAPFTADSTISAEQRSAICNWTGCIVL